MFFKLLFSPILIQICSRMIFSLSTNHSSIICLISTFPLKGKAFQSHYFIASIIQKKRVVFSGLSMHENYHSSQQKYSTGANDKQSLQYFQINLQDEFSELLEDIRIIISCTRNKKKSFKNQKGFSIIIRHPSGR